MTLDHLAALAPAVAIVVGVFLAWLLTAGQHHPRCCPVTSDVARCTCPCSPCRTTHRDVPA